jgi:hypothetical protein
MFERSAQGHAWPLLLIPLDSTGDDSVAMNIQSAPPLHERPKDQLNRLPGSQSDNLDEALFNLE